MIGNIIPFNSTTMDQVVPRFFSAFNKKCVFPIYPKVLSLFKHIVFANPFNFKDGNNSVQFLINT